MKIYIVEDSHELGQAIQKGMQNAGYDADLETNGQKAFEHLTTESYDLLVLDINLPGLSGFEIAEKLKSLDFKAPIVAVTARDGINDKLKGFDLGFVDYITKPFDMRELIARIDAALKQGGTNSGKIQKVIKYENINLDKDAREVKVANKTIDLTKIEFELLSLLMSNQGRVVKNSEIVDKIWGEDSDVFDPPIRTHIKNLRKKIKDDNYEIIKTVPGVGYKMG